jgi:hypothetical protein
MEDDWFGPCGKRQPPDKQPAEKLQSSIHSVINCSKRRMQKYSGDLLFRSQQDRIQIK